MNTSQISSIAGFHDVTFMIDEEITNLPINQMKA